jgi:2,5-diamino-6-(ribosylamino)-4(3H)-pyrimidinone 5'-phosphate reductase
MSLPITTLFMLMSLDGKISTGSCDDRDFDEDLPHIDGVSKGLKHYYQLEKKTDLFSFNTGKVMAKVGWNEGDKKISAPVTFIIVDNKPHLTVRGVENLIMATKKLFVITSNRRHSAVGLDSDKLEVIQYEGKINLTDLFQKLAKKGVDRLTIQSGGEMNASLLRAGLINFVSIVVAPVLVGGKATPTLVDGDSLEGAGELKYLRPLKLIDVEPLTDSYLHLKYEVANE